MCVSGGKKYSFFWKIWHALFFWNNRFETCLFALLPTNCLIFDIDEKYEKLWFYSSWTRAFFQLACLGGSYLTRSELFFINNRWLVLISDSLFLSWMDQNFEPWNLNLNCRDGSISIVDMITFLPSEYLRPFLHGGGAIAKTVWFIRTTDSY